MTDRYLQAIAGHAGPDGWAAVSTRALAAELDVHHGSVARALAKAVTLGALVVENRPGTMPRYRLADHATPLRLVRDTPCDTHATPERRGAPPDGGTPLKGGDPWSSQHPPKNATPSARPGFASGSGIIHNWEPAKDYQVSDPETAHAWFANLRQQLDR